MLYFPHYMKCVQLRLLFQIHLPSQLQVLWSEVYFKSIPYADWIKHYLRP